MMRDDHIGCAWLYPAAYENVQEAASALTDWFAAFGPSTAFMNDSFKHFQNDVLCFLALGLKLQRPLHAKLLSVE